MCERGEADIRKEEFIKARVNSRKLEMVSLFQWWRNKYGGEASFLIRNQVKKRIFRPFIDFLPGILPYLNRSLASARSFLEGSRCLKIATSSSYFPDFLRFLLGIAPSYFDGHASSNSIASGKIPLSSPKSLLAAYYLCKSARRL